MLGAIDTAGVMAGGEHQCHGQGHGQGHGGHLGSDFGRARGSPYY